MSNILSSFILESLGVPLSDLLPRYEVAATFCGTTSVGCEFHIQPNHRHCPGNCRHSRRELLFLEVNPCLQHHLTIWLHYVEDLKLFQSCFPKRKKNLRTANIITWKTNSQQRVIHVHDLYYGD